MILADLLLIAALLVGVVALWWRGGPYRTAITLAAAAVAVAAGTWAVLDHRWQGAPGMVAGLVFLLACCVRMLSGVKRVGRFVRLPAFAFLTLLAMCGMAVPYLFPVVDLPVPGGPYKVGVRDFELRDTSRLGLLRAVPGKPRRLLVRVWYPARAVAEAAYRPYFSEVEAVTTARGLGALIGFPAALSYLSHVRTNTQEDVPLDPAAGRLPAVFFSHGYFSFLGQNTALMEELASHGYSVWSIQHTDESSDTVFPDGDVVPMDTELLARTGEQQSQAAVAAFAGADFGTRLEGHLQYREDMLKKSERIAIVSADVWLRDRIFVLDQLAEGKVPASVADIVAASDLVHTGQAGMSFGGSTAGGLCQIDRRCAAGVNLDGLNYHFSTFDADMPVPFLMLHADTAQLDSMLDKTLPRDTAGFNEFSYERLDHAGQRADIHRYRIRDAAHMGFTDLPLFVRRPLRDQFLGATPAAEMIRIQNDLVRGFFDRYLRGLNNGFPHVQQEAHRDWVMSLDNAPLHAWWQAQSPAWQKQTRQRIEGLR